MIHLDTNVLVALLAERSVPVRRQFDAALLSGTHLAISVLAYFELMYGAAASQQRAASENGVAVFIAASGLDVLNFDEVDAQHAGDIRDHLKAKGKPIGPYDVLVAGQARRHGATLVTAKTREFSRVPGLNIADWSA